MHETNDRQFDYLDETERDLIESVENDEWTPVEDVEAAKKRARQKAMTTLQRDERCSPQEGPLEFSKRKESSGSVSIIHTKVEAELLDHLTIEFGVHGRGAVEFLWTASELLSSIEQRPESRAPRIGETIVYCLREAMTRLLRSQVAPHGANLKDVTRDVVGSKKRYDRARGLAGTDEQGALEDLLRKIDQLEEIREQGSMHEQRLIAAIVERAGTHPLSANDAVDEYLKVIGRLNSGLHDSSSTREAAIMWSACVGVLRRLFLPPQTRNRELDGLAQTAVPAAEDVARARDLITTPTHLSYFLARVQTPSWLKALSEAGIVDVSGGEAMWPALGAAQRLSRQNPTEVIEWLTSTYEETHKSVERARAIGNAALDVGSDGLNLVCRIARIYPYEPGIVYVACAAAKGAEASSLILESLADIVLNQRAGSFRHEVGEIAERLVRGVDRSNGERRLRLLSQKIGSVSKEDFARQRREHTLEGSVTERMDEGRGDRLEILLSALTGLCRKAREWMGTLGVIGMVEELPENIRIRVGCWLLGTGADIGVGVLIGEIADAISQRRPHGDDLAMIDRVREECDPAAYGGRWEGALGPAPAVEEVGRTIGAGEPREQWWRAYYWVPLVCDVEPADWAGVLSVLSAKYGGWGREDLTPRQPTITSGWVRSPYSQDELASVPVAVACRKIAEWQPMENQLFVSGRELGRTLEKVVEGNPEEWTRNPLKTAVALRHPTYIRHYLVAVGKILEEGTAVPVEELLTLLFLARSHPWEAERIRGHRGRDVDVDWSGVDEAAVGVIKALADSNRGFGERRDEVWEMLAGEARNRSKGCAIRAGGEDELDPLEEAINRPCTQALEAVLGFMGYEFRNAEVVRPDALVLVEETLRLEGRDGLQHRAIVAPAVGFFLHVAPEWLESCRDLLFGSEAPSDLGQRTLDQALKWGQPMRWLLEGCVDGVRDAVNRGVAYALHRFLTGMLFGWRGYSLREALSFLTSKSKLMTASGDVMARMLRDETEDSAHVRRAVEFWKLAIKHPGVPEGLEGFGWLACVASLDDTVWCDLTVETLDRTSGQIEGAIEVAERAARLPPSPIALRIMDTLVRGGDDKYRYEIVSRAVDVLRLAKDVAETDEYRRLETAVLERGADL